MYILLLKSYKVKYCSVYKMEKGINVKFCVRMYMYIFIFNIMFIVK